MARTPKQYEDDDGRTVADMNVEGMPWFDRELARRKGKRAQEDGIELPPGTKGSAFLGILAAIALVTVIFAVVFLLVILIITLVGRHGLST
ncbi:MAG: hypothetical protein IK082_02160 [Oscillospiraceae bacterium]|nr:hypothetical protein [Oscillospiraceae bacterium]